MQTETLANTEWDVVIEGTGLPQSLLALALSRSGKKILHVDRNSYYGGDEASFGLTVAEEWASKHSGQANSDSPFSHAVVKKLEDASEVKLGRPRAYELSLAPQLLYSRSSLLEVVVSSQIHNQLDFQAIGSWFVIDPTSKTLAAVPGSREDIFRDDKIDMRAKRSLMKLLRSLNAEQASVETQTSPDLALSSHLEQQFGLPSALHAPILALTMSMKPAANTSVDYAIPRVVHHLRSIGMHAPGCPALLQRYGGLAEVIQVACRANAVGGGVYVLGTGTTSIEPANEDRLHIELDNGDRISSSWHVGSRAKASQADAKMSRSVSIVSSALTALFKPLAAGAVVPAGAVVMMPGETQHDPPVFITAHSGDSGECPAGQCILYASIASRHDTGYPRIEKAIDTLLRSLCPEEECKVLWSLEYQQECSSSTEDIEQLDRRILLPALQADLVLQDQVVENVKAAWLRISGEQTLESFMRFDARDGTMDDEEDV